MLLLFFLILLLMTITTETLQKANGQQLRLIMPQECPKKSGRPEKETLERGEDRAQQKSSENYLDSDQLLSVMQTLFSKKTLSFLKK